MTTNTDINTKILDPEQVAQYWRDGFCVVPGLIGADAIRAYDERFLAIAEGRVAKAERMLVVRDVMVVKGEVTPESPAQAIAKLQDFEDDPELWRYATDPSLLDAVQDLIGEELFSINTMLINKPPGVDGRHPLHQDLLYFPFRPADKIVGTWTAFGRATKDNGCLVAVPGSHRGELYPHTIPDWEHLNAAYYGIPDAGEQTARVHLEMEPGDTLLFHPLLIHGSGRNRTRDYRRAISAHYGASDCRWEWSGDEMGKKRRFVGVRGAGVGEAWSGRRADEGIDPFAFFPRDDAFWSKRDGS